MAKSLAIKFDRQDKSRIRGKVQHSRTGACTARGKCYHGEIPRSRKVAKGKGGGL
jgi:hypothetical protein